MMRSRVCFHVAAAAVALTLAPCGGERSAESENGHLELERTCSSALSTLQQQLQGAASEWQYRDWGYLLSKKVDSQGYPVSAWYTVTTGQIFLFDGWDGDPKHDPYKGDKESFGNRARWFFLGSSWESFSHAANYGGGGHLSWAYHNKYWKFRKPGPNCTGCKGTFWDTYSPRVISYSFRQDVDPPKLLDGRNQSNYETVLEDACGLEFPSQQNNRHSIDKWPKAFMTQIIDKMKAAGIDGILEAQDQAFSQVVLFEPAKHLKWGNTIPGHLSCKDGQGPHYSYTFRTTQYSKCGGDGDCNWKCDFRNSQLGWGTFRELDFTKDPPVPIFKMGL